MKARKKILVVGPSWVGDMVMTQTLFQLIKSHNPDATLHVLAHPFLHPLLARMPEVTYGIPSPFRHGVLDIRQRVAIGRDLKKEGYTSAIVIPNSFKSAMAPFVAGIPRRVGWRGEMRWGLLNDVRRLDKSRYPLMIQRLMALGLPARAELPQNPSYPRLRISDASVTRAVERHGLHTSERPILALCPGAEYGPAKQWPAGYFAEVARQKAAEGWGVWLFGGAKDREISDEINHKSGGVCKNLTGKTDLGEAIDLLSLSTAVVSNDSGLMHVAAALDRPLVVIYGSSSPDFTPPLTHRAKILSLGLDCSPCFKRRCPLKHTHCLKELTPPMVLHALGDVR